tara:strand:+ start:9722 stop:11998 length:2277 start_codon:yes stop_codon:yes gene_type:complete
MSKSLAETVNFGEAVQQKGYEKRAQQVDTFVQSETAQQKLARSGKAQTAQAIQALAGMGSAFVDAKAKIREQEVQVIKDDLANITAYSIEEARLGNKPYDNETFRSMPVRFQVRVRSQVGEANGARAINEAAAGITDDMRLSPEATAAHLETFAISKEILTGMDAHEKLGFDTAWNNGLAKINNGVIQAQAAEGQKQLHESIKFDVSKKIAAVGEDLLNNQALTGEISTDRDMNVSAQNTYIQLEPLFKSLGVVEGVTVPASVRKDLFREQIILAAQESGNHYLLAPENIPVEYQDDKTVWLFNKARLDITDKREAEVRQERSDANSQYYTDVRNANIAAYDGGLTRDNASTGIELDAVIAAEKRTNIKQESSSKNVQLFEDQIEMSIAMKSDVLLDADGNEVLVNGNTVPVDKQSLLDFLEFNPNFNQADATRLMEGVDEQLVGFDISKHLSGTPMQMADVVIKNSLIQVPETLQGSFTTDMQEWYSDEYETNYYNAKKDKGWANPLTPGERKEVRKQTHKTFLAEVNGRLTGKSTDGEVDLDGNVADTVTSPDVSEDNAQVDGDPVVTPSNQEGYDLLTDNQKGTWEKIKNNPEMVKMWTDRGYPVPASVEEVQGDYDEVRATVDMSDEDLEEMLFGVANYEYGDGFRSTAGMDRTKFGRLDEGTRKVLMDRFINTKANEFVSLLNGFYNKTFDTSLQTVYEKDIEEVVADPKNVMKMDQFLKGTLKNRSVIQGEGTKDPIPWLEQLKRTDWYKED